VRTRVRARPLLAALALAALLATGVSAGIPPKRDLSAYGGLGTWIDIYGTREWAAPEATVAAITGHPVRTLFLQTGNYRQTTDLVRPGALGRFVEAAHEAGVRVVAWYLPSLADPVRDLRRALAAIRFVSPAGERFDSFALDIEASVVQSVPLRNARLLALSAQLRAAVGPRYPLGAIVPSQIGIDLHPGYWPAFPYRELARVYDVFLPMAYFSYRGRGGALTQRYVGASVTAVRTRVGNPAVPVHVIGGVAEGLGAAEANGFMRAIRDCVPLGFSWYDFPTTTASAWSVLTRRPANAPASSCASRWK
jgi:hypothetical protein